MGGEKLSETRGEGSVNADIALSPAEVEKRLKLLFGWQVINGSIEKNYRFRDFLGAIAFVNRVAGVAEMENHHPDILVWNWNNVKLTFTTHRVKGLSDRDFALASKVDAATSNNSSE